MTPNDDLYEGLRAWFADVRLGTPVENILARGRHLHRSRRVWPAIGAGAGSVAAAVALTLGLTGPAAQPVPTHATLTDWSVTTGAHHTVSVSIRERRETSASMAGLSRALNAAGVPALVRAKPPASCPYRPFVIKPARAPQLRELPLATFRIQFARLRKGTKVVIVVPLTPRAAFTKIHRSGQIQRQIQVRPPHSRIVPLPAVRVVPAYGRHSLVRIFLPQVILIRPGGRCEVTPRLGH